MQFIDLNSQYRRLQNDIEKRINKVLEHGQYIHGPEVQEVETQLADYIGVKHCLTVANGTDALFIALSALDIKAGDEVITSAFSFAAVAEMIVMLGAVPVFVDIEPRTFNLDPNLLERVITMKTKAIVPISLYGQCANYVAINEIAKKHGIAVIEDAAQSLGATHYGKSSGSFTTIACTSFYPAKPLGCYGDGGACFTDDDALAEVITELRNHGQSKRYHHVRIGINSRLDTIQASILLAKLSIFTEEIQMRNEVASIYNDMFAGKLQTPFIEKFNTSVYAQYTLQLENRERIQQQLQAANIPTAVHYPMPLHLQPAFADLGFQIGNFPQSESAARKVLSLPIHPYLTKLQQQKIVNELLNALL